MWRVEQRLDTAFREALLEIVFVLLSAYQCELKLQRLFGRNFFEDPVSPVQMNVASGSSRRADKQRHVQFPGAEQQQSHVAFDRVARERGLSGTEIVRAGISGARITADEMWQPAQAFLQRAFEV